jgi:hypothetical protein
MISKELAKKFGTMERRDLEVVFASLDVLMEIMLRDKVMCLPFLYISGLHKECQGMLVQKIRDEARKNVSN